MTSAPITDTTPVSIDTTDLGGDPEPETGATDTDVPPFFGTRLGMDISGMRYAAEMALRHQFASWRA